MQNDASTKIDPTDIIILKKLLVDARKSYKDIAQACRISPPAVTKRIESLRTKGVIVGTRIGCSLSPDYSTTAIVGLNLEESERPAVKKAIENRLQKGESYLTVYDEGIGFYDVVFGLVSKSIYDIDEIHHFIEGLPGIKNVDIHLWNGRIHIKRDNLQLR
jgi:Lrp/AsnC family transcriptional regulator for asnA, asnC and gidA